MDIESLLRELVKRGGSDLHICVGLPPVMRIQGSLLKSDNAALEHKQILDLLQRVVLTERKITFDSLTELDLGFEISGLGRFRCNIYTDRNGIAAAFRHIPEKIKTLEELGLPAAVSHVCYMKKGLVIVTGLTGSGKTTTLASLIDKINRERSEHIITIEDPIEFIYKPVKSVINQRELGTHTNSFLSALKASLREDPNIILVGELRDLETISMAMTAAETGHLVLTTLHTGGAAQVVDRIIDVFPPHQQEQIRVQLAHCLEMVISQVLVPSIDKNSRCLACEIMLSTNAIRHLIRERKTFMLKAEIETGFKHGMLTLEKSLQELVNTGKISPEVAAQWEG